MEKRKEAHGDSLDKQQKKKIEREEERLKNNNRDLSLVKMKFALEDDSLNMENVIKIAKMEYGVFNRKIMLNIQIPLVRMQGSTIFRMQKLPALQTPITVLYIKP